MAIIIVEVGDNMKQRTKRNVFNGPTAIVEMYNYCILFLFNN